MTVATTGGNASDKERATTMQIQLNGQTRQVEDAITIAGLLAGCGYGERKVAVEVNQEIVPRSAHATRHLAEGDRIEVVTAFGGG